jgi:hypothetical protein
MKALIIGLTLFTSISTFAETVDLRSANSISCQSDGLGSFYLANLQSNPIIVSSTAKNIKLTGRAKNSINFSYSDYKGYNFKMIFNKIVKHEDESGHLYNKLSGVFVNGDTQTAIECFAE